MDGQPHAHLAPGVYADISDERYHADRLCAGPTLSNTIGKTLLRSPLHAWTKSPRLNPDHEPQDTTAFRLGKAAHSLVLGKGAEFVTCPTELLDKVGGMRTAASKEWKADQEAAGRIVLNSEEAATVRAMADKLRQTLIEYGIILDPGQSELTAIAEIDGVMCRCRVDNAPSHPVAIPGYGTRLVMTDYKTIEDASPESCQKAVEQYGYDFQKQFYQEVWRAAAGEDRLMIFIFQEKKAPFEVAVVALMDEPHHSADFGESAAQKVAVSRAVWADCLATGIWPGYPRGILVLGARPFHSQKWQDRMALIGQTSKPSRQAIENWTKSQAPEAAA